MLQHSGQLFGSKTFVAKLQMKLHRYYMFQGQRKLNSIWKSNLAQSHTCVFMYLFYTQISTDGHILRST